MSIKLKKIIVVDTNTNEVRELESKNIKETLESGTRIDGIKEVSELFKKINTTTNKIDELSEVLKSLKDTYSNQEIKELVDVQLKRLSERKVEMQDVYCKTAIETFKSEPTAEKRYKSADMNDETKKIVRDLIYNLKDRGYSTETIGRYVKKCIKVYNDLSCELNYHEINNMHNMELVLPNGIKRLYVDLESSITGEHLKFRGNLEFPDTLENIDDNVFEMCDSVVGEVKLPKNLKKIGTSVFKNCINLTKIKFNDKLEKIESEAFCGCTFLEGKLEFPSSLKRIEKSAFSGCKEITEVKFNEGIKEIGSEAFNNCVNLQKINLPDSINKIGSGSFKGCKSLKGKVSIPNGITRLESNVFGDCENINEIQMNDIEITEVNKYAFNGCKRLEAVFISKDNKNYISSFKVK